MKAGSPVWAVGLMSGTSLDGVDAALIETDGEVISRFGPSLTVPYEAQFRDRLRQILDDAPGLRGDEAELLEVEQELTRRHADAVTALCARAPEIRPEIIGFHGQTILHQPEHRRSWQIGDAALLQKMCGLNVIYDFRSNDLLNGGEGAPLVPVMHAALLRDFAEPVAVLNIGGVANVTLLGAMVNAERPVWACDTGPGNALLDDWAFRHTGISCDYDGALARRGKIDRTVLEDLLALPYFGRPMPKSLDRLSFHAQAMARIEGLSAEDGAATLAAFTVESIIRTPTPEKPQRWLVAGGGRHNPVLMDGLARHVGSLEPVDRLGWDGDALEAQCFGLLAVRYLRGLPSSWPQTTGVSGPCVAGRAVS